MRWIVVLIGAGLLGSCKTSGVGLKDQLAQASKENPALMKLDSSGYAVMRFDSSGYDLGTVTQGEIKETEIYYTNLGIVPLVIEQMSSCECTTLDYSVLPLGPGKRSKIKVRYNSKDKSGAQIIDIDILVNTATGRATQKIKIFVTP